MLKVKNHYYSLLRYAGGKSKMRHIFHRLCQENNINIIFEGFCGSSAISLYLLFNDVVKKVIINDIDYRIYSFWKLILSDVEYFIDNFLKADLSYSAWLSYKAILNKNDIDIRQCDYREVGFATYFVNRTSYNGNIYNANTSLKQNNLNNIRYSKTDKVVDISSAIFELRDKIELYNRDCISLVNDYIAENNVDDTLFFFDPPYYNKASSLYRHHYQNEEHSQLADWIKYLDVKYLITYDDCPEILELYRYSNIDYFTNPNGVRELIIYGNLEY